jgi:hypothetical protein
MKIKSIPPIFSSIERGIRNDPGSGCEYVPRKAIMRIMKRESEGTERRRRASSRYRSDSERSGDAAVVTPTRLMSGATRRPATPEPCSRGRMPSRNQPRSCIVADPGIAGHERGDLHHPQRNDVMIFQSLVCIMVGQSAAKMAITAAG